MAAARLRTLLVAAVLLCVLIFSPAAADDSNSVCTANDAREECSEDDSAAVTDGEEEDIPATCVDTHEDCRIWSDEGECDKNPDCEYTYIIFSFLIYNEIH
jgi:hypothetical protein